MRRIVPADLRCGCRICLDLRPGVVPWDGFTLQYGHGLHETCIGFLDQGAVEAVALGWTTSGLFGVSAPKTSKIWPDLYGCPIVSDAKITPLAATRIALLNPADSRARRDGPAARCRTDRWGSDRYTNPALVWLRSLSIQHHRASSSSAPCLTLDVHRALVRCALVRAVPGAGSARRTAHAKHSGISGSIGSSAVRRCSGGSQRKIRGRNGRLRPAHRWACTSRGEFDLRSMPFDLPGFETSASTDEGRRPAKRADRR